MHEIEIKFRRLTPLAVVPAYQSALAAGMDLHAAIAESVVIEAGAIAMIPCGFALEIPAGFEGQVRPRSGLASKFGVSIPNAPGTVDADYRGEMKVALINHGRSAFTVEPSMRVAQLVIAPVVRARISVCEALTETARGAGGFGSTGG
ncbi:MAG: dUTP diphosphatase [Phycisphaerales bacterium]|nr:dUTP diphosphatase [Phycisphaerales bacterium]